MDLLFSVTSLCFAIAAMGFTYSSRWCQELTGKLFYVVTLSMPIYTIIIFSLFLQPTFRNLRFHSCITFLLQGLVYGCLAWFTDEIGEKHPEPYLVLASSAWAVHFCFTALRLEVYRDYGVTIGFLTVAIVTAIHLTSLASVKLSLMFGGGFLLAGVSQLIKWATTRTQAGTLADCEQGATTSLHHAAADMRTEPDVTTAPVRRVISRNRNNSQPNTMLETAETTAPSIPEERDTTPETAESARIINTNEVQSVVKKDAKRADSAFQTPEEERDTTPETAESARIINTNEVQSVVKKDAKRATAKKEKLEMRRTTATIPEDSAFPTREERDTSPETAESARIINTNEVQSVVKNDAKRAVLKKKPLKKPMKTIWTMSMLAEAQRVRCRKEKLDMRRTAATIPEDSAFQTPEEERDTTPETAESARIINTNEVQSVVKNDAKRAVLKKKPLKKPVKTIWRMSMLAEAQRVRRRKEKLEMRRTAATIPEDSAFQTPEEETIEEPQCEAKIQQETAKTARQAKSQNLTKN